MANVLVYAESRGTELRKTALESVTAAVRSVVSMVTRGGGDEARGEAAQLAPA